MSKKYPGYAGATWVLVGFEGIARTTGFANILNLQKICQKQKSAVTLEIQGVSALFSVDKERRKVDAVKSQFSPVLLAEHERTREQNK